MRRLLPKVIAIGLILGATSAAAAEPETLICAGRRTAPDPASGAMRTEDIIFRLSLDPRKRQVVEDGRVMVIRDWSDRRVVYSDFNPGILSALAGGLVTTLDRDSGAWRNKWGGGTCKAAGDDARR